MAAAAGCDTSTVQLDVSLVPAAVPAEDGSVLVVIDQIRASTTITTLLDLGVGELLLAGNVTAARRMAREHEALLAGEWRARKPKGFDFDNSPSRLVRADVAGRRIVLSTTNGTAVLHRVRAARHVLIGALRNARACARAATAIAAREGVGVRIVCAGRYRRFVLEDAYAAGAILERVLDEAATLGHAVEMTDAALVALRLRAAQPDPVVAMTDSDGGRTLHEIGQSEDVGFCAQTDASETVPVLVAGPPMRIERLDA
jgi:2-phosphosulfolactate phosphatase